MTTSVAENINSFHSLDEAKRLRISDHPEGSKILEHVIPAKEYLGLELKLGQTIRIVDLEGKQVPDIVCFNLNDTSERLSCNNTRLIHKRWQFSTGHALYSDEGNEMMTIVADTVGIHHASGGCCNDPVNYRRFGSRGTRNCRTNLALASESLGINEKDIPGAFCAFMKVRQFDDGRAEIEEPTSRPGDYIDFRADMDLFVAISNCPQDKTPCNGFNPTPLKVIVYTTR